MTRGRFISFEGGEGAGKSTQVALLAAALRARGHDVLATREPGGSPGAEAIRELLLHGPEHGWLPLTEALLHYAARNEHLARAIVPALERGTWVVTDRFADSTMAYQSHGMGLGEDTVRALGRLVLTEAPDLVVVLDLPVDVGLERARARSTGDRYERMSRDFHDRVRQGFLAIAKGAPERCVVLDATLPAQAVHDRVWAEVGRRLAP